MILVLDDVHTRPRQDRDGVSGALKGVSLRINRGEIYGLLGPAGSGKSTTLAAAIGLIPVSGGSVRLFNRDPRRNIASHLRNVGFLPQHHGLDDWMTAEAYLAYFAALYGLKAFPMELDARLELIGLETAAGRLIATFSPEMKQRLGLARAMIANPRLLVLDEPTQSLDRQGRRDIHDVLLSLSEGGTAVLIANSTLDDAERLYSRVGFITRGRTIAQGTIPDLLAEHARDRRYRLRLSGDIPLSTPGAPLPVRITSREPGWAAVDIPSAQPAETVWRDLMFRGWPIVEVVPAGGGLEELYLELTSPSDEVHRRAA